ncbi:hypothetical protein EVAR_41449_1 [Eumeta japonica]|uniref:Uncharacterized protein n=1 Tax=Eumeta variegata TaxID=151549 RepID=A0A4C1W3K8_EUMVA|nr:hypothetical protein EVAR_41449_1 [Eumeta japonica]
MVSKRWKKSRGRPNKRWEDDLRKIAGPVWSRLVRDRDKWKSLEEAFVDRQAVQQKQPSFVADPSRAVVSRPPAHSRHDSRLRFELQSVAARVQIASSLGRYRNRDGDLAAPPLCAKCAAHTGAETIGAPLS